MVGDTAAIIRFESLILEVLVKLFLLIDFTHSGHTYNKNATKINTVHNKKIFSMICMHAQNII
jgi:hypothetical protein